MALRAQFQMLILVLHVSSTPDSSTVQSFTSTWAQDLLWQSLLKVATPLEDVRRCDD